MLELGIFARVFPAADPDDLAATISAHGFTQVQLNLIAVGLPTIPSVEDLAGVDLTVIAHRFHAHDLDVWGVSATYNMAHPDPAIRTAQTRRAAAFVPHVRELGSNRMTLCTGTRDPDDKWRAHPENGSPGAWSDMMSSFSVLADAAAAHGVELVVEPEPGNVVAGTDAGLRLIDELGERGDVVRFILDPANLVAGCAPSDRKSILEDAFARLGDRTVCVHAKDVVSWGERLDGAVGLDFSHVMRLCGRLPNPVPVIIQDTTPEQVDAVVDLLRAAHAST
jgi:sugar phosphate isomerase/epimerase